LLYEPVFPFFMIKFGGLRFFVYFCSRKNIVI